MDSRSPARARRGTRSTSWSTVRLRITRGGVDIASQGPGDFLGEISLIDGRPRTATATAVGPVNALAIERPDFIALIDRYPAVRLSILMALTDRIRRDERDMLM